jgi:hypothetical protein
MKGGDEDKQEFWAMSRCLSTHFPGPTPKRTGPLVEDTGKEWL